MNQAVAETQNNNGNLSVVSSPRMPAMNASGQALMQRTLAEVQIAVMMAKQFPRDKIICRDKLLNDCCREDLARVAMYIYARGGTEITGPSIRLAEAAKNAWGNMQSGWRELTRGITPDGKGFSEIEAFAWDAENNTRESLVFTVLHWRDKKGGQGYPLKDERDIYELCANQAARRERACILKSIDGDMIEIAIKQCTLTLHTKVQATPEKIAEMLKMFEELGVTKEQIEKRIQRRMDAINAPLLISLGKIYNSVKNGMSGTDEWFEKEGAEENKKSGNQNLKDKLKKQDEPESKPSDAAPEVAAQNHVAASSPAPDTQEKPKTAMFRRTNSEKKEETKEETAA